MRINSEIYDDNAGGVLKYLGVSGWADMAGLDARRYPTESREDMHVLLNAFCTHFR